MGSARPSAKASNSIRPKRGEPIAATSPSRITSAGVQAGQAATANAAPSRHAPPSTRDASGAYGDRGEWELDPSWPHQPQQNQERSQQHTPPPPDDLGGPLATKTRDDPEQGLRDDHAEDEHPPEQCGFFRLM